MKTPFKPGDLVERIEPNPDGTHDVEMISKVETINGIVIINLVGYGLCTFMPTHYFTKKVFWKKLSTKEVLINLDVKPKK